MTVLHEDASTTDAASASAPPPGAPGATPTATQPVPPAFPDPPSPPVAAPLGGTRLSYQPALDGLRGLAVAAVVLYHAAAADEVAWLRPFTHGGFLGVSAFFTLSGFLICTLLLRERSASGTVSLRAFWARRARRLLPAVLLLIGAVAVLTPAVGTQEQLASLPGDAWASLLYVANWRFIVEGSDYAAMFTGAPSPLRHVWSLAVEEQWYLLVPLAAVAVAGLRRRRALADRGHLATRGLLVGLGIAVLGGTAWMVYTAGGAWDNRAYMGTDTRLAEMAVGAVAAVLLSRRLTLPPRTQRLVVRVAPVGVAALLLVWALTPIRAPWLYRGGLTLHAMVVALVIVAAVQPHGAARRVLSTAALVQLGRISYGVYLFHWPIVWWVTPERLGLGPTATMAVQVALTLAIAAVSYRLLEHPIRRRSVLRGRWALPALAAGVVAVAAAIVLLPSADRSAVVALGSGTRIAIPTTTVAPTTTTAPAGDAAATPAPTTTAPPPPPPLRVMVVGDSFAESALIGLQRWGLLDGGMAVMDQTIPACPFGRGGRHRGVGIPRKLEADCNARDENLLRALAEFDPEVVLVAGGMWDITDRRPVGLSGWTHPGRPDYDAFLTGELNHLVDLVASSGARVIWANSPYWDPVPGSVIFMGKPPYAEAERDRVDAFNGLLGGVVAARPEAELLDIAGWLRAQPGGELDPALRPDGVHFSEASTDTLAQWLGPELMRLGGRTS